MIPLTVEKLRLQYREEKTTPEAVIKEILNCVEADRGMNIWITPPTMEHIRPYLDRLASLDPEDAPLWGIPFAIKDNIDVAGMPTTAGCPDYTYVPEEHATVVKRLIEAGAIPLGKTNLDQFATGLVGTRSPYGETKNALREELISGGSSSGSAVAVARGHAAFSLGTDTAGSGRVPAALNGLVGFKSSLGAWPKKGVVPACASLDCVTVFTHTIEDALQVDHIIRGEDPLDPWSEDIPLRTPAKPLKILIPDSLEFFGPFAMQYEAEWKKTAERIKDLQIPVESIDIRQFAKASAILYDGPFVAERWSDLGGFIESHPGAAFSVTEKILKSGADPKYTAASVFRAIHKLQTIKKSVHQLLGDAVLVMPTTGGTWTREEVRTNPVQTNSKMGLYTNHCNLLDMCAIAVPAGEADTHLPFGITIFAKSENDHLLFGAASTFVAATNQTPIAVCGLHMRGFPLEKELVSMGGRFVKKAFTAPVYQLFKLPFETPKPGLVKNPDEGAAIEVELWEMPADAFGTFTASIPAPLGIGKVELADGSEVPGFLCEAYAAKSAEDITSFRGWRNYQHQIKTLI
ncbi:allophanate hydrolase [Heyndrickxia coagulans]|uniref:Allophanate hydrolase n=1 Tax=Heyndrickxia coagulans 36D1 TaxID=345219 RepID=G2TR10_HEYCO|nr:allophanate hydrolase [Heyndrickxia coagulans]AEP00086.1 allophanate hydrolase [Heyndrickxia coagulans 36D1]